MKNSYLDISQLFEKDFPDVELLIEIVKLEKGKSHCLFFKMENEEHLINNWERITNSIALHYQRYLETDFEKWNLYLFFLLPKAKEIDLELKYTIENNTFSSRKIVEDVSTSSEALLKKHINNQLSIKSSRPESTTPDFEYNPIIWETVKDKTIKKAIIVHEEQMKTYEELITKLKEQNEI